MSQSIRIITWTIVILVLFNYIVASRIVRREIDGNAVNPVDQAELEASFGGEQDGRGDREKRLGVIKSIGIKAVLLNLIFGKLDQLIDFKTRQINELDKQNIIKNRKYFGITPPPKRPANTGVDRQQGTTQPPISFPTSTAVSLVLPDQLFGSSFTLITNISRVIGDVLFNTAARAQEFVDRARDIVKRKFGFATRFIRTTGPNKKTQNDR